MSGGRRGVVAGAAGPILWACLVASGCGDPASPKGAASPSEDAITAGASAPAASPAAPEDPAERAGRDALLHVVRAETTTAFHGYRTLTQGPRGVSRETRLRVVARGDGGMLLEAPAAGDEAARRWSVAERFVWVRDPELLLRNYRVRLDDRPAPPVAWRETRRLEILPRHPNRPSLELLVDAETWVVLAESHRAPDGAEWRSARFDTIEYGAAPPEPGSETAVPAPIPAVREARPADWSPLGVTTPPTGFVLVACGPGGAISCGERGSDPAKTTKSWREDWTDGLAGFSLLQVGSAAAGPAADPAEDRATGRGDSAPAAEPEEWRVTRRRWLGGASLHASRGGSEVRIVGTLAADELMTVLAGLRPAASGR